MEICQKVNLHNRFDLEIRDQSTGEIRQTAFAENIILDALWGKILTAPYFVNIHFGSGTGTLSAARTSLFTHLDTRAATGAEYSYNKAEGWMSVRRSIQLLETEHVGATLREVGIAYGAASTNLVTHALLKDMNGNPVSITKTNVDVITIYATVYLKIPAGGWLSNKVHLLPTSSPTDYASYATTFRWLFGMNEPYANIYTRFDFMGANPMSMVNKDFYNDDFRAAYKDTPTKTVDSVNKKITFSTRVASTEGNDKSVKGFWSVGFGMGSAFTPVSSSDVVSFWFDLRDSSFFTGSQVTGEVLGTGNGLVTGFKTVFPFPRSGAVVKVDGVQVSGVTVDSLKPPSTNLGRHLNVIDRSSIAISSYGINPSANVAGPCAWIIAENPYYATYGIASMTIVNLAIYASDDLTSWSLVRASSALSANYTIPAEYQGKRYWKLESSSQTTEYPSITNIFASGLSDLNNVQLTSAPGLVIDEAVGTGDGSSTSFSIDHTAIGGSLTVKINGGATIDYTLNGSTVIFNSPPASGATITADYRYICTVTIDYDTPVVAKDSNYAFDFAFSLQFGEWAV